MGEPNFALLTTQKSNYGNPYLFTASRVDILDTCSLKIQYSRNRYYDYYTGRFTTHDPLGITPAGGMHNPFSIIDQYRDGVNLYEYVGGRSQAHVDPYGFRLLQPYTCPGRTSDPEMERDYRKVWWKAEWEPFWWSPIDPWTGRRDLLGWPEEIYKDVNYKVRGWAGVSINVAAGGECGTLVEIFWETWAWPNYHEVVEKHLDCEGSWHSYGRPCRAFFKCKQKCCYGESEWERKWTIEEKFGVLAWGGWGGPYCDVGDEDPKKICWDYSIRCVACKIPK